jgi:hypothetical protein
MPKQGVSRKEYRTSSQELDGKMIAVGEIEGIQFAFDRTEQTPNTSHHMRFLRRLGGQVVGRNGSVRHLTP